MSAPPNKKQQRYDRQLRLWQAHGQQALESASVCLVNANATGAEILKNLVLPGIGSFTIVDPTPVSAADIGSNFFVTVDDVGKPRAQVVAEHLRELNDEVQGEFIAESPATLLATNPSFFNRFSLVVVCNHNSPGAATSTHAPSPTSSAGPTSPSSPSGILSAAQLTKLEDLLWDRNVPAVLVKSYGFVGTLRVSRKEHRIVEPHPDAVVDLRLHTPFPELAALAAGYDLEKLDSKDHGNVPFVVLLLKANERWKKEHPASPHPTTSADRQAFKALVSSMSRNSDEENFQEAAAQAYRAWQPYTIPDSVTKVLEDPEVERVTTGKGIAPHPFWIIARAVRDFVREEGHGFLPHPGVVPDMKSDTNGYVSVMNTYRQKHLADLQAVRHRVQTIVSQLNAHQTKNPTPAASVVVKDEEILLWVKNAAFVKVMKGRKIADEYGAGARGQDIARYLSDPDSPIVYYVLMRAVDKFYEEHRRFPGETNDEVESDIRLLKRQVQSLLQSWGVTGVSVPDDHIHEVVRSGASELHAMAAFQGGVVSQECIKLVTAQYVPVQNTFVFDGIRSAAGVFDL